MVLDVLFLCAIGYVYAIRMLKYIGYCSKSTWCEWGIAGCFSLCSVLQHLVVESVKSHSFELSQIDANCTSESIYCWRERQTGRKREEKDSK